MGSMKKTIITSVGFTDCKHCDFAPNKDGHDACLGELPGVMNACCGHGDECDAYVQFDHSDYKNDSNKQRLSGKVALNIMKMLKEDS